MNKSDNLYLVFDSNYMLANRTSEFINKKDCYKFSYQYPFKLIKSIIVTLFKINFSDNNVYIVVSGFRLPDLLILRIANLLKINSIYIQHGIFLTHLNRDYYFKNSKLIPYIFYFLLLTFLFISPFKIYKLYKRGKSSKFPYPNYSIIYNKYWAAFHKNLLGWEKSKYLKIGLFDLSRNKININGEIS